MITPADRRRVAGKVTERPMHPARCRMRGSLSAFAIIAAITPSEPTAASFEIGDGQVETAQQVLEDSETGVIQPGGALTIHGLDAVLINGPSAGLDNQGRIETAEPYARGIVLTGNGVTVTNRGKINTSGQSAPSISIFGRHADVVNTGIISATGDYSEGLIILADSARLVSSGTIETAGESSDGIFIDGNDSFLFNLGTIRTEGRWSNGMESRVFINNSYNLTEFNTSAINNSFRNQGTIDTLGDMSTGIESYATAGTSVIEGSTSAAITSTVINEGDIRTWGELSRGILLDASSRVSSAAQYSLADATNRISLINHGAIETLGRAARGMELRSIASTSAEKHSASVFDIVHNSGSIRTSGSYSSTIDVDLTSDGSSDGSLSSVARIINSGELSTADIDSHGIRAKVQTGEGVRDRPSIDATSQRHSSEIMLINQGDITTLGGWSDGVQARTSAYSISAEVKTDVSIVNTGSIRSEGQFGYAIESFADAGSLRGNPLVSVSIANSGNITTGGEAASAVYSRAWGYGGGNVTVDVRISNEGSVRTVGDSAHAIWSVGFLSSNDVAGSALDVQLTNDGNVSTSGRNSVGILADSQPFPDSPPTGAAIDTQITNNGIVVTRGEGAPGIQVIGSNATIDNRGLVRADRAAAILGDDVSQTLNLLPGSRIVGLIDLGGNDDNDIVNIYGAGGPSALLTFTNTETINLLTAMAHRLDDDTVLVHQPALIDARPAALARFTDDLHGSLPRQRHPSVAGEAIQLTALKPSSGLFADDRVRVGWGQLFGNASTQSADRGIGGYDHDYGGLMAGYDHEAAGHWVGWFAGVARASTHAGDDSEDTDTLFAGIYAQADHNPLDLRGSLIIGAGRNETDRVVIDNLAGPQRASGGFNSYFISPSVSLGPRLRVAPDWELRPSLTATYSLGYIEAYREQGAGKANLRFESQLSHILSTRWQVESAHRLAPGSISLHAGVQTRHIHEKHLRASLDMGDFRIRRGLDDNAVGGFVGAGIQLEPLKNLHLVLDVERGWLDGDERSLTGWASLEYQY